VRNINVRAWCDYRSRPKSKLDLVRLVRDWPAVVFFDRADPEDPIFPNGKHYMYVDELPVDVTLTVAELDAVIERTAKGLIVS
jgi:hypothetical protein